MSAIDFSDPAVIGVLSDALVAAGVDGLEISGPDIYLRVVVGGGPACSHSSFPAETKQPRPATYIVKAPMAGHFCPASFVASGPDGTLSLTVGEKHIVGFVRVGAVMLPVPTGRSGRLSKQLSNSGALVGFGDPLFEMEFQP